ncbi:TauD/TfdA family dioxygenase [Saccharomonospora sp. NPDC006951]
MTMARGLTITALGGALGPIGAEVRDIDLAEPQPDAVHEQLRAALCAFGVLVARRQRLTHAQHEALADRLGQVTSVRRGREQSGSGGWRVEATFTRTPPSATMLSVHTRPANAGDLRWQSMTAACDALSSGLRRTLTGLRAVHRDAARGGEAVHPVITRHPVTGRDVLFVNPAYTVGFEDWTRAESAALLRFLFAHAAHPGFGVRLRGEPGTMVWWDNRQVWHRVADARPESRAVVSRSTFAGTVPAAAAGQ